MVGLVLSPEQVRSAPPEVRAWLHALLEAEYGGPDLRGGRNDHATLAALEPDEAAAVLQRIGSDFLTTQVFFELGRESAAAAQVPPHLHRVAIPDMLRHTQIGDVQHLAACLDAIAGAFRAVRGDPEANLVGFDQHGGCYVHATTRQSIQAVWRQLARQSAPVGPAAEAPPPAAVQPAAGQPAGGR